MYRYMYRYVQIHVQICTDTCTDMYRQCCIKNKYDPFIDLGATIAINHMLNVGRAWKLEQGKREQYFSLNIMILVKQLHTRR